MVINRKNLTFPNAHLSISQILEENFGVTTNHVAQFTEMHKHVQRYLSNRTIQPNLSQVHIHQNSIDKFSRVSLNLLNLLINRLFPYIFEHEKDFRLIIESFTANIVNCRFLCMTSRIVMRNINNDCRTIVLISGLNIDYL